MSESWYFVRKKHKLRLDWLVGKLDEYEDENK